MLAIRLQRTGRSGHAQFRVIVQDSRFSPTRGRVVAYLGSYNPHTKAVAIDSQKAAQYLENGAQPSDTAARLLKQEGVKLPDWVKLSEPKKRTVRNPEKRRSTSPEKPAEPAAEETNRETETQSEKTAPQENSNDELPTPEEPSEPAKATEDDEVGDEPAGTADEPQETK